MSDDKSSNQSEFKYVLLLQFVVVIWSFTAILGKLISVESGILVWYRMLIAVAGLAVYFLVARKSFRVTKGIFLRIFATGILVAAHWVFFFESIKRSNVSVTLVCLSLSPFIMSLIEPLLFGRRFRPYEGLLGIASAIGIASVYVFETQYLVGILFGILAAIIASIFVALNGLFIRKCEAHLISFYELLGGFFCMSLYVFFVDRVGVSDLKLEASDIGYLLILGLVCTSFAYSAGVEVMKVLTPFTVMLIVNLEPVYGIILALIVFGESEYMSAGFYFGAALILASISLNGFLKRRNDPSIAGKDEQSI